MAKKEKNQSAEKASGKKGDVIPVPDGYVPRLKQKYTDDVVGQLTELFNYSNRMEVPTIEKVVINVGMGDAHQDQRLLDSVIDELETITGQKAVVTRARKSISNFKLREGMQVGARVTLRKAQMWEFVDRLFTITIPRVRDFRGLSDRSFDGRGNYSLGIKEQIVFPEIDYDKVVKIHGMDISIVTSAQTDEEGRALLKLLGCPFIKRTPKKEEVEA